MDEVMAGWDQWGKHVLAELERAQVERRELSAKMDAVHIDINQLKIKAVMWGAGGGSVFGGGAAAVIKALLG